MDLCIGAKSSFVSYDGRYESLIDHFIIPVEKAHYVKSCEICDDNALNVSRHRPIFCNLLIPVFSNDNKYEQADVVRINWKKVTNEHTNQYQSILQSNEALIKIKERELTSEVTLDQTYTTLVYEIKKATQTSFPKKKFKRFLKPYWNQELGNLHREMKIKRGAWIKDGKPRNPNYSSYFQYKSAKRDFRRSHRKFSDLFLKEQNEEIDRLAELDSGLFWRLVNNRRKKTYCTPGSELIFNDHKFDTSREITEQWAQYFEDLYTPKNNTIFDELFKNTI